MSDLLDRMRSFEQDHEPHGWPAVQIRDISALCDLLEKAEMKAGLFRRACEDLLDDRPLSRAVILLLQAEAVESAHKSTVLTTKGDHPRYEQGFDHAMEQFDGQMDRAVASLRQQAELENVNNE